jgi:hypothetical protein
MIALVAAPLQATWFPGGITFAFGVTVMVNIFAVPGQLAVEGVTVIVAVTGVLPGLMPMKAGIFPVPLAPKPIEVLLFVQL